MTLARLDTTARDPLWQVGLVTTDQVSNSTSFANVGGLTVLLKPNRRYIFEAHMIWSSSATTEGGNFSVNGPSTPTNLQWWREVWTSATAHTSERQTTYDSGTLLTSGPGAAFWPVHIFGAVENGANAGNLVVRWRAETGGANTMTIRRGSYFYVAELV